MSRLQELHPDQQAVLQLVLRRRLPYADLGDLLGLDAEGVRERALDAIDGLAPDDVPGLDPADRDRIADHLLGQDRGAERRATATLLASHSPAHAWATTIANELGPLGGPVEKVPAVPGAAAGEPVAPAGPAAGAVTPSASSVPVGDPVEAPASTRSRRASSATGAAATTSSAPATGTPAEKGSSAPALPRNPLADQPKGLVAGGVAAVVVVILLVVWISGGFSGGDDSESASTPPAATTTAADDTASTEAAAAQFVAALPQSIPFRAPQGATGALARVTGTGTPTVSSSDAATPVISLTIQNLPTATSTQRYYAWADKNGADPIFLGELSAATGAELLFQGLDVKTRQATVVDPSVYTTMRITRETSENPTEPGPTVISGRITPTS